MVTMASSEHAWNCAEHVLVQLQVGSVAAPTVDDVESPASSSIDNSAVVVRIGLSFWLGDGYSPPPCSCASRG